MAKKFKHKELTDDVSKKYLKDWLIEALNGHIYEYNISYGPNKGFNVLTIAFGNKPLKEESNKLE
jgi:hypothetical protein